MIITATTNDENDIPAPIRHYAWEQNEDGTLPLTPGKKYVVSGIWHNLGYTFYLIIADENELTGRPWWYPADVFKVLDETRPSNWIDGEGCTSFPELAHGGIFNNNLQDGDEKEMAVFMKYYEQYARAHDLWYVDGKPVKPSTSA